MPRRNRFDVDAESVQGIAGAKATFTCITVGEWQRYRDSPMTDTELLQAHLVGWSGFVDDDDNDLPSPTDEPEVVNALYLHEQRALVRLMWLGPDGPESKNAVAT